MRVLWIIRLIFGAILALIFFVASLVWLHDWSFTSKAVSGSSASDRCIGLLLLAWGCWEGFKTYRVYKDYEAFKALNEIE